MEKPVHQHLPIMDALEFNGQKYFVTKNCMKYPDLNIKVYVH